MTSGEFSGPANLFGRLDRDEDRLITPGDFDWSDLPPMFDEGLAPPQDGRRGGQASPDEPSLGVLLSSLLRGDLGSFCEGPGLGQAAPDFALRANGRQERVGLSQHRGKRPVVLIFGNMTCGPFRSQAEALEALHRHYGERVAFLTVYVREAHPIDGWRLPSNDRAGIALQQPQGWTERTAAAAQCCTALKMTIPLVTDELDNRVGHAYSGLPTRLYLIDSEGRVAYKSGRGPFGLKPGELEQSLVMLLMDEAAGAGRRQARVLLGHVWAIWERWAAADQGAISLAPISAQARTLLTKFVRATTAALSIDRSRPAASPVAPERPGDRSGPRVATVGSYSAPRREDLPAGK